MRKLAVFFPGIGYTVDKPLMYYSRKLAAVHGYDVKLLPYTGFPEKILGDRERMIRSYEIALTQAEEMLDGIIWEDYEEILFLGKSIGTAAAAAIAAKSQVKDRIRLVLYTPLEETFAVPLGESIAFTGSKDQWTGKEQSKIPDLCSERGIPCTLIPGGNHSLECGNVDVDITNMKKIMDITDAFMTRS